MQLIFNNTIHKIKLEIKTTENHYAFVFFFKLAAKNLPFSVFLQMANTIVHIYLKLANQLDELDLGDCLTTLR